MFGVFNAERNQKYSRLTSADVATFESILGPKGIVTDEDELAGYNIDWTKKFVGKSKLALRPATTEETAECLRYCNSRKLAVVP